MRLTSHETSEAEKNVTRKKPAIARSNLRAAPHSGHLK